MYIPNCLELSDLFTGDQLHLDIRSAAMETYCYRYGSKQKDKMGMRFYIEKAENKLNLQLKQAKLREIRENMIRAGDNLVNLL